MTDGDQKNPTAHVLLDWVISLISMMVIAGTRTEWRNVREDRSELTDPYNTGHASYVPMPSNVNGHRAARAGSCHDGYRLNRGD